MIIVSVIVPVLEVGLVCSTNCFTVSNNWNFSNGYRFGAGWIGYSFVHEYGIFREERASDTLIMNATTFRRSPLNVSLYVR